MTGRLLAHSPDDPDVLELMRLIELQTGATHPAIVFDTQPEKKSPTYPELIEQYLGAADLYFRQHKVREMIVLLERAESIGSNDDERENILKKLAEGYRAASWNDLAESTYLNLYHLQKYSLRPSHPRLAESLYGAADAAFTRGENRKAKEYLVESIAIIERMLGNGHPDLAIKLHLLAKIVAKENDWENALHLLSRGMQICLNHVGPGVLMDGILGDMIVLLHRKTRFVEAEREFRRWERIQEDTHKLCSNLNCASLLNNISLVFFDQNRFEEAGKYMRRALEIYELELPGHRQTRQLIQNLILVGEKMGNDTEVKSLKKKLKL